MERIQILLMVLLVYATVGTTPFWLPKLFAKSKLMIAKRITKVIVKSWGISMWSYSNSWQARIYFLNSAGKVIKMALLDFNRLRMPEGEMPEWWILRLGLSPEEYDKEDKIHLIHKGRIDQAHWHFYSHHSIINESQDGNLELNVYDRDGKTAIGEVPKDQGEEGLFANVLSAVGAYRDINDAWIKKLNQEGSPILEETKDTMGKSKKIGALRYAIEHGPQYRFKFDESILPNW